MSKSRKIVRFVEAVSDVVSGYLMGWLIVVLMCMILIEVLTRYILRSPLAIADELGGYMLVAMTCMGLAYTWKEKGHIRIELLVNKLPGRVRDWLRFITVIMATVFAVVLIKASYELVSDSYLFATRSGSWLRTPLIWPQMVLIIGSVLLFVQLIAELIKAVGNLKKAGREA